MSISQVGDSAAALTHVLDNQIPCGQPGANKKFCVVEPKVSLARLNSLGVVLCLFFFEWPNGHFTMWSF